MAFYKKTGLRYLAYAIVRFITLSKNYSFLKSFTITNKLFWAGIFKTNANIVIDNTTVTLRGNGTDPFIFDQIFTDRQYEFDTKGIELATIIDMGANIGMATVFFKNRFINATIIAVEPDAANMNLLKKNTTTLSNIFYEQCAVWYKTGTGVFINAADDASSFAIRDVNENDMDEAAIINTITINDIVLKYNLEKLDLVKMDIEGAEREIFKRDNSKWLSITRILIIELHDMYYDNTAKPFFDTLINYKYSFYQKGENLIFIFDR
jgi:FkbM family methyltransferase